MLEVERCNLVSGREYYIECLDAKNVRNKKVPKKIAKFKKLDTIVSGVSTKLAFFSNYHNITDKTFPGYDVHLNNLWKFYEVKKHVIQSAMEKRNLDLILLHVVKDEYFKVDIL